MEEILKKYTPVIGMEIHIELKTNTKMFCSCSASWFGSAPNTHTCPVCLGLPGALPVANKKAIKWAMLLGLAYDCEINTFSKFDRKHYFYPDLAKSFQISQYDVPFSQKGTYTIVNGDRKHTIRIKRIHLEEDTGKLMHKGAHSLVDFNRAGVPLIEIVTEPDFDNASDVKVFLEELQVVARYLDIADADMDKGSMRLEPNISLRKVTSQRSKVKNELPPYKVEVKNINSFRFVKRAIEYEILRQAEILESGHIPPQETRGYNEAKGETVSQRIKEGEADYRYFPEPDIPPFVFGNDYISELQKMLPELPHKKIDRYMKAYHILRQDAYVLTRDKNISHMFEKAITFLENKKGLPLQWESLLAKKIVNKKIQIDGTTEILVEQFTSSIQKSSFDSIELEKIIDTVLSNNDDVLASIKEGKTSAIQYLIGQVMKETKGKAGAEDIKNIIMKKLSITH